MQKSHPIASLPRAAERGRAACRTLRPGETAAFDLAAGDTVSVSAGTLWVTDGSGADYLVRAGERFKADRKVRAVVQGIGAECLFRIERS